MTDPNPLDRRLNLDAQQPVTFRIEVEDAPSVKPYGKAVPIDANGTLAWGFTAHSVNDVVRLAQQAGSLTLDANRHKPYITIVLHRVHL